MLRICTIVARNYLSQAEVLAESFVAHHPGACVSVLIVDDRDAEIEGRLGLYEVLRPEDLDIPRFEGMAAMYDVTELCTAVKPWLLAHLLQTGEPVAYFDPDICFYADVESVFELASKHEIVLTPHMTRPFPEDGQRPNNQHVLKAGAYNLGFIALGPGESSRGLLDWWSARLRYDCIVDIENDLFVDQRWFDMVPGMFPGTSLLTDPGANVAYWNLHEHEVRVDASIPGRYLIDGVPLKFFHFSGFDIEHPELLSRHQTRVRLREAPIVAGLCLEYAHRVLARRGHREIAGWPFDRLADGRLLSHRLRRLYRDGERGGAFALSPFTPEGTAEFLAWLADLGPDAPGEGINRYWSAIYASRPDLQLAFPALAGADGKRYHQWIAEQGPTDLEARGLLPASLPRPDDDPGVQAGVEPGVKNSSAAPDDRLWGVNVVGYLQSELGVGESARAVISALDAVRMPLVPIHGRWRPPNRQDHHFATLEPPDAVFPVNLLCINADMTPGFMGDVGPTFRAGRYTIGLWWWEVPVWPEAWNVVFDHVDEVWVASDYIRSVLAPVATVPVTKVTLPVRMPSPRPKSRAQLRLPEGFLFLFMFDYASIAERKNPFDLIDAFTTAFDAGEGAKLVIKCINMGVDPAAHARLRFLVGGHPDIEIYEGYVSPEDKNSMLASADCYVSLHRSEGFGLALAESQLLGKPVIATRHSGNLDFMTPDGGWLVDAALIPVGPHQGPYPPEALWAQPDIAQASRFMREIFNDPAAARERSSRGAASIRRSHSPQAAGRTMLKRLELLRAHRDRWEPRHPAPETEAAAAAGHLSEPAEVAAARALLNRGPLPGRVDSGRARTLLRNSALRAMKPHTAFEQQVDQALLAALRAVSVRSNTEKDDGQVERVGRVTQQIGVLLAAVRAMEDSIAEVHAQVDIAPNITEWLTGLASGQRGLETHVVTLEGDVSAHLSELEASIAALVRQIAELQVGLGARFDGLGETVRRADERTLAMGAESNARIGALVERVEQLEAERGNPNDTPRPEPDS